MIQSDKIIFTFTAPSGAGKDYIGGAVMNELGIPELISTTSREPRIGEVDGVHYQFIKKDEIPKDAFAEYVMYDGNQYGLTKEEINHKLSTNNAVFCIIDKFGLQQLNKLYSNNIVSIFIDLPGQTEEEKLNTMAARMKNRGDSEDKIQRRINNAIETKELSNGTLCDYIVLNDDAIIAKNRIRNIIEKEIETKKKRLS